MEKNYWQGKSPCWIVLGCSQYVYHNCPAYQYPERPCWEIPYTRCETLTNLKKECEHCKVYKLYGKMDKGR